MAKCWAKLGLGCVGFDPGQMTVVEHEEFKATAPTVQFKPVGGRVEELRAIKDKEEVAAIRQVDHLRRERVHDRAGGTEERGHGKGRGG